MAFVNSGIGSQLVYAPEATWGVAPSLASAQPLEFTSETLALTKNTVQGQGIHAGGMYNRAARRVITYYSAAGGVTMDLPTQYLNELLKVMFGSKGSTAAALQSSSAVAGVSSTSGYYLAAHSPVATGGTGTKGASLTFQKGVAAVDGTAANPFTYTGCKVTDWTLNVATGAIATLQFNVDGYNELTTTAQAVAQGDPLNTTAPTLATYTEAATNNVFNFRNATLYQVTSTSTTGGIATPTLGAALGLVRSVEIKHQMNFDTARYFVGGNGFKSEQVENNWRSISGQFVVDFPTAQTMYNAFAVDTQLALQLNLAAPSGNGLLQILIPAVYLDGESPKVSGPGVVQQNLAFTGLDISGSTPVPAIQAVYKTIDTV